MVNIEAMIEWRLQEAHPKQAIAAALALARFLRFSGGNSAPVLESARTRIEHLNTEEQEYLGKEEQEYYKAEIRRVMGSTYRIRSQFPQAKKCYDDAAPRILHLLAALGLIAWEPGYWWRPITTPRHDRTPSVGTETLQ